MLDHSHVIFKGGDNKVEQADLEAWKSVLVKLLPYHSVSASSELRTIPTEFIPFTDYREGSRYSLLDNNVACAHWIKNMGTN